MWNMIVENNICIYVLCCDVERFVGCRIYHLMFKNIVDRQWKYSIIVIGILKKLVEEGEILVQIHQSDIGKRIVIRYKPSNRRLKGIISNVTNRAVEILTDRKARFYISFSVLEKYDFKIHWNARRPFWAPFFMWKFCELALLYWLC